VLASRRALRRRRSAATPTVATGWGRNLNNNLGLGWQIGDSTRSNSFFKVPTPMEIKNAQLLVMGYGQASGVMGDRSTLFWGQNHAGNIPIEAGPTERYAGFWEWRWGLKAQLHYAASQGWNVKEAEEGKGPLTLSEIQEKVRLVEAKGEMPFYEDKETETGGSKHVYATGGFSVGQMVYPVGATVLEGGKTWQAKVLNCGIRPGPLTDPEEAVWGVYTGSQVAQFYNHRTERYEPFFNNKSLPVQPPLLNANVKAVILAGVHGHALMNDGTVRSWGYIRLGDMGDGIDKSWGPKPRPKLPRPPYTFSFKGTVTKGSKFITATSGIAPPKSPTGGIPPTKVKTGALFEAPGTAVLSPNTEIGTGAGLPNGTGGKGYDEATHEVEMTQPALADFTGTFQIRPLGLETGFWHANIRDNAGYPIRSLTEGHTITALATGAGPGAYPFTLALTDTGEVLAWGSNNFGTIGDLASVLSGEKMALVPQFVKVEGGANMTNIKAVACGEETAMALTTDGKVWIWGKVEYGQAGKAPLEAGKKKTSTPILMTGLPTALGERPAAICASQHACYVLLENGKVMAWGGNEHGELGNGTVLGKKSTTNPEPWSTTPTLIPGLANVKYIAAGRQHAGAVTTGGALYTWGGNESGQIGDGTRSRTGTADKGSPVLIYEKGVLHCAIGEYNTLACLAAGPTLEPRMQVRLVPAGEYAGELRAKLRMRWRSTPKITGWSLNISRQSTLLEEAEFFNELEEWREVEEDEESTAEQVEEAKEEKERLELLQEERENSGSIVSITPTEVAPGLYEYLWEPPSPMTPTLGWTVRLINTAHETTTEPREWEKVTVQSDFLWESPYSFAAF
jgi:alpha-tubulin suppressor-like RCC1 family protein